MDLMEMRLRQQPRYWSNDYIPERNIDCPVLPPVSRPVEWNKKHRARRDRPNVVQGFEMISPTSATKLENHQKNWLSSLPWSYAEAVKKPNNKQSNQAVTKEEDPAEGSSESSDQENMSREAAEINYDHNTNGNASDGELHLNPDASEFVPGAASSEKDEMTTSVSMSTTDDDNNDDISEEQSSREQNEENETKRESSEKHGTIIDEECIKSEKLNEINGNIYNGNDEDDYERENTVLDEDKENSPFLQTNEIINGSSMAEDNLVYFEEDQNNREQQLKDDIPTEIDEMVVEHNPLPDTDESENLITSIIEEELSIKDNKDIDEIKEERAISLGNELNFEELVKNKTNYSETHFENGELCETDLRNKNESSSKKYEDDENIMKDIENQDTNEECTFSEDYQISEELNEIKEMLENEANRNSKLNECKVQNNGDDPESLQDDLIEPNEMVEETSFSENINGKHFDDQELSEEFKLNSCENISNDNKEYELEGIEERDADKQSIDYELEDEMKINENFFNEENERENKNEVMEHFSKIVEETPSETENDSLNDEIENNPVPEEEENIGICSTENTQPIETNYSDTDDEKENIECLEFNNMPQLNDNMSDEHIIKNISQDIMTTSMYESQDNDSSFEIIYETVETKDIVVEEEQAAESCEVTSEINFNEKPTSEQINDKNITDICEKLAPEDKMEEETDSLELNNSSDLLNTYVTYNVELKDDQFSPTEENSQLETYDSSVLHKNLEEAPTLDIALKEEVTEQIELQRNDEAFETEENETIVQSSNEAIKDSCLFIMNLEEPTLIEMTSNEQTIVDNESHDIVHDKSSMICSFSTFENEQDLLAKEGTIHETEEVNEILQEDESQVVPEMPTEDSAALQTLESQLVENECDEVLPCETEVKHEEHVLHQVLTEIKEEENNKEINTDKHPVKEETNLAESKLSEQIVEENHTTKVINELHTNEICEAQEIEEEAQFTEQVASQKLPEPNTTLEENASFEIIPETVVIQPTEVCTEDDRGEVSATEEVSEYEKLPNTDESELKDQITEDSIPVPTETELSKETINLLLDLNPNLQSTTVEEVSGADDISTIREVKSEITETMEEEKDIPSLPEIKAKEIDTSLESPAGSDEKLINEEPFSALSAVAVTSESGNNGISIMKEVKSETTKPFEEEKDIPSLPEIKTKEIETSLESPAGSDDKYMTEVAATALSAAAITTAAAIGVAVVAQTVTTTKEHDNTGELKKEISTDAIEDITRISSSLASEDLLIDNKEIEVEPTLSATTTTVNKVTSALKSSAKPSSPTSKSSPSKTPSEALKPSPTKASGAAKPAGGAKPAASAAKPAATGAKPTAAGAKPAASGAKPAVAGAKPAAPSSKPANATGKPTTAGAKPAATGAKPAAVGVKLAAPTGAKPAATGAKPAAAKPGSAVKPSSDTKATTAAKPTVTGKPAAAGGKPAATTAKLAAAGAKPAAAAIKPGSAAKPAAAAKPSATGKPAAAKLSTPAKPGSATGAKPTSSVSPAKPVAKTPAAKPAAAATPKGPSAKPSTPTSKPGTPTSKTPVSTKPGTPPKSTASTPAKPAASKTGTSAKSPATKSNTVVKPSTPPAKSTGKSTPTTAKASQPIKKPGSPTKQSDVSSTVPRPSSSVSEKNGVSTTNGPATPIKSPAAKAPSTKAGAPAKTPAAKPGTDKTDKLKSAGNKTPTKAPVKKPLASADKHAKNTAKSTSKDNEPLVKNDVGEGEEAVTSTTAGDLPIENGSHIENGSYVEELQPPIIV